MNWRRLALGVGALMFAMPLASRGHFQASSNKTLIAAIQAGSPELVRSALQSGVDPNAPIDEGKTNPLMLAITAKTANPAAHLEVIDLLLSRGADPAKQRNDGVDALYLAATVGEASLCSRFCKAGVSPFRRAFNGVSAFHIAAIKGDTICLSAMLPFVQAGQIDTPTSAGHYDSALTLACGLGRLEAAKLLLDHGANPNFQMNGGRNPIFAASVEGHANLVDLLINHGAKVDLLTERGATALSAASFQGALAVMRVLIDRGADINHQDKGGVTPMMSAAFNGHEDAVQLLLSAGARLELRSHEGLTAADYGKQWKNRREARNKAGHAGHEATGK